MLLDTNLIVTEVKLQILLIVLQYVVFYSFP